MHNNSIERIFPAAKAAPKTAHFERWATKVIDKCTPFVLQLVV